MSDAPFARAKEIARRVNPDESWGQLSANEQATYLGFAIAERDAARLRATLDAVRDALSFKGANDRLDDIDRCRAARAILDDTTPTPATTDEQWCDCTTISVPHHHVPDTGEVLDPFAPATQPAPKVGDLRDEYNNLWTFHSYGPGGELFYQSGTLVRSVSELTRHSLVRRVRPTKETGR